MKSIIIIATICLLSYSATAKISNDQLNCLAETIYHEASNHSLPGKLAVGAVVLNRTTDGRWPNNICNVVKQGNRTNNCQFSVWCRGPLYINKNSEEWQESEYIAKILLSMDDTTELFKGATHFHADYVNPGWKRMVFIVKIDNHLYYREEKIE
jgi:spore germination cell wall hydrolase CwlJ-like protein